jgi:biotin synthase
MFAGDRLLTTENPDRSHDHRLFERLGIRPEALRHEA